MNFLVIGTNFISDRFVNAAGLTRDVSVTAVYSRTAESGSAFAARHGIATVYTDLATALADRNIDAVYVASPTVCHAEHTVMSLEAGKHVLCEKLMGAELADFVKMRDCAEKSGKILLEAMRPVHDPFFDTVRESLPKLGKITHATLEFCQYSSRYDAFLAGKLTNAFDPKMKNTALADIGVYPLNVALMLFGEPSGVSAHSTFLHNGFEGEGSITLDYGELHVDIIYSKLRNSTSPSVIVGEHGTLTIDKMNAPTHLVFCKNGTPPVDISPKISENNMVYEIAALRDAAAGKLNIEKYMKITENAQKIIDLIYKTSGISDRF